MCGFPVEHGACPNEGRDEYGGQCETHRRCRVSASGSWLDDKHHGQEAHG